MNSKPEKDEIRYEERNEKICDTAQNTNANLNKTFEVTLNTLVTTLRGRRSIVYNICHEELFQHQGTGRDCSQMAIVHNCSQMTNEKDNG